MDWCFSIMARMRPRRAGSSTWFKSTVSRQSGAGSGDAAAWVTVGVTTGPSSVETGVDGLTDVDSGSPSFVAWGG